MRFSLLLPTDRVELGDEIWGAPAVAEMAGGAEAAGFHACCVTDHPFPPDGWVRTGGHHSLDPFVALSVAAATTTKLRLHTNAIVAGYRSPFVTAKAIASLDAVSGGRVILGLVAGYLEGEFRALGADFDRRNDVLDETIVAMKRAWTGEPVDDSGEGASGDGVAGGNVMLPRPVSRPHPPIWIGGNSRMAMRRALEHGDAWCPFPLPPKLSKVVRTAGIWSMDTLRARIAEAREAEAAMSRTRALEVCFAPIGQTVTGPLDPREAGFCDHVAELEDAGVSWLYITLGCPSRKAFLENVACFGDDVIARFPTR